MNVRDSPPEVMLSLLSPTFRADAGHDPVDPLELLELELPVVEVAVVEVPVLEAAVLEVPVLEAAVLEVPVLEAATLEAAVLGLPELLAFEPPTPDVPPDPCPPLPEDGSPPFAAPPAPHPGTVKNVAPMKRYAYRTTSEFFMISLVLTTLVVVAPPLARWPRVKIYRVP